MKSVVALLLLAAAAAPANGEVAKAGANPVQKVLEMLSDLQQKIIGEGKEAQKIYDEFSEWCEDRAKELMYAVKGGKQEVTELKACIQENSVCVDENADKRAKCTDDLNTNQADLKAAEEIRAKEVADFGKEEA